MGRYNIDANIQIATRDHTTLLDPKTPLQFPEQFTKGTIALDRDGVLCECKPVISNTEEFVAIANSMRAVAILRSLGYKIAILYDQPNVSRRLIALEQVEAMNQHMLGLLGQAGCTSIEGIFYCVSSKKRDPYAKPNLGLFTHAESMIAGFKLRGGFYVGDSIEDLVMANKAGATPVLVLTGNGKLTQQKLELPVYKLLKPKVQTFDSVIDFALSFV